MVVLPIVVPVILTFDVLARTSVFTFGELVLKSTEAITSTEKVLAELKSSVAEPPPPPTEIDLPVPLAKEITSEFVNSETPVAEFAAIWK